MGAKVLTFLNHFVKAEGNYPARLSEAGVGEFFQTTAVEQSHDARAGNI